VATALPGWHCWSSDAERTGPRYHYYGRDFRCHRAYSLPPERELRKRNSASPTEGSRRAFGFVWLALWSLCSSVVRPRRLSRRVSETMPGVFDLDIGRAVASSPQLCTSRHVFGNVKPNDGARHATNDTPVPPERRLTSAQKRLMIYRAL